MIDTQQKSLDEIGTTVPVHVTKTSLLLPAHSNLVVRTEDAIKHLGDGLNTFTTPRLESVSVEWVSGRNVDVNNMTDAALVESSYSTMMSGVRSKTTIIYFHGGQFWYPL